MCGIAGIYNTQFTEQQWRDQLVRMARALEHRGPDDEGFWFDVEQGMGLAHRRLSILDLSQEGHQPMLTPDRRFVLAYNGEIYNSPNIRNQLIARGVSFKGHSDTEVLLQLLVHDGVEKALQQITGMYAFAFFDTREEVLVLARDPVGIKPLYYGWDKNSFYFASELHAMKACPDFGPDINTDALGLYLKYNYIPTPFSIYKGIQKLKPGHFIRFIPGDRSKPEPVSFWDLSTVISKVQSSRGRWDEQNAELELEKKLKESVKAHTLSDVPLGCFLSGGIDSNLIAALFQSESDDPIHTFTIGFSESGYNEADTARAVASHLGTIHHELILKPSDMLDKIPHILNHIDEPFADSSQIPTWFVSDMTHQKVKVALSGDGGDELFSGYNRYIWGEVLWKNLRYCPGILRKVGASGIQALPGAVFDKLFTGLKPFLPEILKQPQVGQKLHRFARNMSARTQRELYQNIITHISNPEDFITKNFHPVSSLHDSANWDVSEEFVEKMMFLDTITYLPDDILTKVDRASMHVSLESRVPFIIPEIIEFAWSLPLNLKYGQGVGKKILRNILYKHVPRELVDKPKMGFGIPLSEWLRGPLKSWAEDLLTKEKMQKMGFLNHEAVDKVWKAHISGKEDWCYLLWNFLVFQIWVENQHL